MNGHLFGRPGTPTGIRLGEVRFGMLTTCLEVHVSVHNNIVYPTLTKAIGSSAGSAVAVSANIVSLAFSTETDGSIAGPAQINAVVGIKPTPGLTSRSGVIPTSETMDTVGPIARSIGDAVIGLDAIVGADNSDTRTTSSAVKREQNYTQFLSTKIILKGAKFGLPVKGCWEYVSPDQREAAQRVFDSMREAGPRSSR